MVWADLLDYGRSLQVNVRTRSDKLHSEGGEKAAAVAAGSDLWHSNCAVKFSVDMEDVIEK